MDSFLDHLGLLDSLEGIHSLGLRFKNHLSRESVVHLVLFSHYVPRIEIAGIVNDLLNEPFKHFGMITAIESETDPYIVTKKNYACWKLS